MLVRAFKFAQLVKSAQSIKLNTSQYALNPSRSGGHHHSRFINHTDIYRCVEPSFWQSCCLDS